MNKMFLVSPHQLKRLTQPAESSIRQTAEDDLDERMRAILQQPGLNSYEKVKRYEALLQRYLTLLKQGQKDERRVTLSLSSDPVTHDPSPPSESEPAQPPQGTEWDESDVAANEVLKSLPPRDRKNARYIMQKLTDGDGGWTTRGEFVYKGNVVKGSHMIDLFKNLSLPYKKKKPNSSEWLDVFLKYVGGTKYSSIFCE